MDFSPKMIAGAIAVVVALGLFLALRPDDSNKGDSGAKTAPIGVTGTTGAAARSEQRQKPAPRPERRIPTVKVKDGQPVGGVQKLEANQGDDIRFVVQSDVAEEVHVHGFDVSQPVAPGKPARFDFEAGFTGIFEVELENSAIPIMELQVNP